MVEHISIEGGNVENDKPPVPRKILDKRLAEIHRNQYVTLRELETRILKKIAAKTH